jgi:hypothetical protein
MSKVPASSQKPFVFLGPTLPLAEAQRILDAVYLPPVSMGDVLRLMARDPHTIAIVDGLFEQTPAVWHKEILFAMSRGVRVLGASSMGALRAAELADFGMEGVGQVFEAFRGGVLEDDDEVAVAHGPASDGYRSLSEAMVNIRAGLREAHDMGCISAESHGRLIAIAKGLFYPDRSWPRLFREATAMGLPVADLRAHIARARPDVKRADAIRLLELLATDGASTAAGKIAAVSASPTSLFDFEPTLFWEWMTLDESAVGEDDALLGKNGVRLADLRRHVRVHSSRSRDVLGAALFFYLADDHVSRLGLRPRTEEHDLGDEHPVSDDVALLAPEDRGTLDRSRIAVERLVRAVPNEINRRVPAALAHLGQLGPSLVEVRRKQAALRTIGLQAAAPADAGISLDELLVWYQHRFGPLTGTLDAHATAMGFTSREEFVAEVVLEYVVHRDSARPKQ